MEEQFYLLWPPLLLVLLKSGVSRKQLLLLALAIVLLSAIHRAALYQPGSAVARTYYSFDTRADALLIGCAAGMAVTWGFIRGMTSAIKPAVLLLALLLIASDYATPLMHVGGFTVLAFAAALVVINCATVETGVLRRILEVSLLVWIGRISYGLYLWHYPVFKSVKYLNASAPVKLLCGLLTFAVASLSFYLLESPLLRLQKRFA